ncbi:hypothetical protein K402DRAFT_360244 [Aulographum hederae CBS 113979]|uniref:SacI domain-containing protein n=1 Tax=Aulographum hederae CBS 113979 TaxID=1176131 RepID=A0A6G1GSU1_9PEZI|nr:hypothetical protein K402DRAFT_360244 [Aulographum hederae CBS 113979]
MPSIVRKLLIFAAVDGLILQPAPPRNHKPSTEQAIKVEYKTNAITPLLKDRRQEDTSTAIEAHGVIGLLKIASTSFLVSISRREQVAQIRGKPIYCIHDVAIIPLSSQADAERAITQARESKQRRLDSGESDETTDSDMSDEGEESLANDSLPSTPPQEREAESDQGPLKKTTTVAEDVINRKGAYGRFTDRWFSKKGWSTEGRKMQGMSSEEDLGKKQQQQQEEDVVLPESAVDAAAGETKKDSGLPGDDKEVDTAEPAPQSPEEVVKKLSNEPEDTTIAMLPKILRTAKMFFGSRSFYFSYDHDLSKTLGKTPTGVPSNLPMHKTFDPLFFWNQRIASPFMEAGQHAFILPVIQGFVGQRAFSVDVSSSDGDKDKIIESSSKPEEVFATQEASEEKEPKSDETPGRKDLLLTIISRRSVKRAGLRYLRRGVDDEGHVANSVETEQILSTSTWDTANGNKIYSFLQCRGSIPLLFSQSPYSLKPIPLFYGSPETNASAFKLHFSHLKSRYGSIEAASLIDKHGTEASIGEAYEKAANELNEHGGIDGKGTILGFQWFDFHHACRGMKFENVSILMDSLSPALSSHGWTVIENDVVVSGQSGILRTNCMDCLDRTNVVQSAAARNALEQQLAEQNITIDLQKDPTTSWFNNLWADNGDAISRQYAGTAALKGDFTRTRRRNISGALTDFGLTLGRYYNNIVNDYFAQALIDFLLGRASVDVFAEFEADMKSQDYAVDLRKVRQHAIDVCAKIVVEDHDGGEGEGSGTSNGEDIVAGWTLSCPAKANELRAQPFEECVLLLTEKALYFCRVDWTTEKVREFERIELSMLERVERGVYVTSTLAKRHMDEEKNVGFVVRYKSAGQDMVRVNTRSLDSEKHPNAAEDGEGGGKQIKNMILKDEKLKLLAFKALPPSSSFVAKEGEENTPFSEVEMVKMVCEEIARVTNKTRAAPQEEDEGEDKKGDQGDERLKVEEKDVVSLGEAKRSTGYLEQIGYSLKKLVWS